MTTNRDTEINNTDCEILKIIVSLSVAISLPKDAYKKICLGRQSKLMPGRLTQ